MKILNIKHLKTGLVATAACAAMALTLTGTAKPAAADSVRWGLDIHLGDHGYRGDYYDQCDYRDYRDYRDWRWERERAERERERCERERWERLRWERERWEHQRWERDHRGYGYYGRGWR